MSSPLHHRALEAVELAIDALARRDPTGARMAIGIAVEADQAGAFARVADAVYLVASQVEADDGVEEGAWDHLADAVGDSRLAGLVEAARG